MLIRRLGVLFVLAFVPMPARADCAHRPHPDLSPALDPAGLLALSERSFDASGTPGLPDSEPDKAPCFRCGGRGQNLPAPGSPSFRLLDLLALAPELVASPSLGEVLEPAPDLYAFDPAVSIAHPPRAA